MATTMTVRKTTAPQDSQEAPTPRLLLTIEQTMPCLNVSRSQVYRLLWDKSLRSCHMGKRHLISAVSVSEYVARLLAGADEGGGDAA